MAWWPDGRTRSHQVEVIGSFWLNSGYLSKGIQLPLEEIDYCRSLQHLSFGSRASVEHLWSAENTPQGLKEDQNLTQNLDTGTSFIASHCNTFQWYYTHAQMPTSLHPQGLCIRTLLCAGRIQARRFCICIAYKWLLLLYSSRVVSCVLLDCLCRLELNKRLRFQAHTALPSTKVTHSAAWLHPGGDQMVGRMPHSKATDELLYTLHSTLLGKSLGRLGSVVY